MLLYNSNDLLQYSIVDFEPDGDFRYFRHRSKEFQKIDFSFLMKLWCKDLVSSLKQSYQKKLLNSDDIFTMFFGFVCENFWIFFFWESQVEQYVNREYEVYDASYIIAHNEIFPKQMEIFVWFALSHVYQIPKRTQFYHTFN